MKSLSFTFAAVVLVLMRKGVGGAEGRVLNVPTPLVTPAPSTKMVEEVLKRQDDGPDAISLARILLTAVPESLRQIVATNVPAVSSILNDEFSSDKRPRWFNELPSDIQEYLIEQFGPATAVPEPIATEPAWSEPENTWWTQPTENTWWTQPAQTSWVASTSAKETPSVPEASHAASETHERSTSTTDTKSSSTPQSDSSGLSSKETGTSGTPTKSSFSTQVALPTKSGLSLESSPAAPPVEGDDKSGGLSKSQKIGVGVGVPFAIIGAAALLFGCCFLLRRRQRKRVNGSVPPSSPGFIPRFAFQEKGSEDPEHRQPLNRGSNTSFGDLANMSWDDDVGHDSTPDYVDTSSSGESVPTIQNNVPPKPMKAPLLYHTHSSNRARGKRTSYQSLHSVAEVSEPDSNQDIESPVLRRDTSPVSSFLRSGPRRPSQPRVLIPAPTPAAIQIKRKPVPNSPTSPTSPGGNDHNMAAALASQSLLRQTMPDHRSRSTPPRFGNTTHISSTTPTQSYHRPNPYTSPVENHNPFINNYHTYEEDYGPEYNHHQRRASNDSYIDIDDGLYGHRSLSRYPTPKLEKGKTEWPLRSGRRGSGQKRDRSPLWDRVYEG